MADNTNEYLEDRLSFQLFKTGPKTIEEVLANLCFQPGVSSSLSELAKNHPPSYILRLREVYSRGLLMSAPTGVSSDNRMWALI